MMYVNVFLIQIYRDNFKNFRGCLYDYFVFDRYRVFNFNGNCHYQYSKNYFANVCSTEFSMGRHVTFKNKNNVRYNSDSQIYIFKTTTKTLKPKYFYRIKLKESRIKKKKNSYGGFYTINKPL